jgi:cytidine deaminase
MRKRVETTAKIRKGGLALLEAAFEAMSKAYVLWGVRVGAAVLAEDGRIYEGCNVESWISGLGICAERCAINHAVLHGNKRIKEVAVVMEDNDHSAPRPCGSCLQYIHDFASNAKVKVIMARAENGRILMDSAVVKTVGELLPFAYRAA